MRGEPVEHVGACKGVEGFDELGDILMIDQAPVGTTPKANAATYCGAWNLIRKIFGAQPKATELGYSDRDFHSTLGQGVALLAKDPVLRKLRCSFSRTSLLPAQTVKGRALVRVNEVRIQGKSIADVLAMTINEAVAFFSEHREVFRKLSTLRDVGLGYLRLGQPLNTVSGGEAQRLKLATHLAEAKRQSAKRHAVILFSGRTNHWFTHVRY